MGQTALSDSLRSIEAEIAAGQAERALAHCQELQTRYPRALSVQRVLGEAYLALRKPREALGALDRALAGDPEDARACCARAIIHQIHGDAQQALAWYRRACDVRPEDQALRQTYREMAAALGEPAYRPSRVGLARLYLRGDLFTHALREWETLLAEKSDLLEAQVGLAETLWRAGRLTDAAECGKRILANAPTCMKAMLLVALIAHESGSTEEAQRLAQRAAELDPDHRIAQFLFADRLAIGDPTVRRLFWGKETPSAAQASTPSLTASPEALNALQQAMQPHERKISRPLVDGAFPAVGLSRPSAVSRPIEEGNGNGVGTTPLVSPGPRSSALPADFSKMFDETKNMIWGADGEESNPGMPATVRPQVTPTRQEIDPFGRSAQFVPPAIAQQSGVLGDTEARSAINWVQWLQAQGARAIPPSALPAPLAGAPSSPLFGPFAAPPSTPLAQTRTASTTSGPPPADNISGKAGAGSAAPTSRKTAPLPAPTPEALRSMFAQLEPETRTPSIVDADILPAGSAIVDASPPSGPMASGGELGNASEAKTPTSASPRETGGPRWSDSRAQAMGFEPEDSLSPELQRLRDLDAQSLQKASPAVSANSDVTHEETQHHEASGAGASQARWPQPQLEAQSSQAATTLEALDRQFAASGFQPFTPQRGLLETLAEKGDPSASERMSDGSVGGDSERHAAAGESGASAGGEQPPAPVAPMRASAPSAPLHDPWDVSNVATSELGAASLASITPERPHASGAFTRPGPEPSGLAERDAIPAAESAPRHEPQDATAQAEDSLLAPAVGPDTNDYPARLALARRRREEGDLDQAFVEYGAILRNAPELLPEALSDLEASLQDAPDHPELHKLLGDARIRQGDYFNALESYNRSVALTQGQDE